MQDLRHDPKDTLMLYIKRTRGYTPSAARRIGFSQFRPGIEKEQNNPENPARPVKQLAGLPVADRGFTGVNPV